MKAATTYIARGMYSEKAKKLIDISKSTTYYPHTY